MAAADRIPDAPPHIPVLLRPLLDVIAPVSGRWLDGTFGAGGYSRALLEAGAEKVIGVDRDPSVFAMAAGWATHYGARLDLVESQFSRLLEIAQGLDGVVLDLGVSSMQIDQAERGFSFQKDGPLDMRMSQSGPSAADLCNRLDEVTLADVIFRYGEDRASRRIARAIVAARPLATTLQLAEVVARCLPRAKPGQSHPATRTFQALRIAVNDEYRELYQGLMGAERALGPGGILAVVTFHSVEDRMVKRFMQARSEKGGQGNRFSPEPALQDAAFEQVTRKAIAPDDAELAVNPRARSARLRIARRTEAPAGDIAAPDIAMPQLKQEI